MPAQGSGCCLHPELLEGEHAADKVGRGEGREGAARGEDRYLHPKSLEGARAKGKVCVGGSCEGGGGQGEGPGGQKGRSQGTGLLLPPGHRGPLWD